MTLERDSTIAASLASSEQDDNPLVAYINSDDLPTYSTDTGTIASGYSPANAGTYSTFDRWGATPDGSGHVALGMTYGSAEDVTFIGLAVHNIATLGGSVRPQYSTNGGSTWNNTGAATISPTENRPLGWQINTTSAADWRILVTGLSAGVTCYIGHAFAGQYKHTFGRRLYRDFAPAIVPTQIETVPDISEGGELLGTTIVRRGSRISPAIMHLAPTDMRSPGFKEFMRHYNDGKSFFFAWRPKKYKSDFYFGWRPGGAAPINPSNSGPNDLMSVQFAMQVYE